MSIVGVGPGKVPGTSGSGSGGYDVNMRDLYPSWGPSRSEAFWLAVDVGLYFTPLSAIAVGNRLRLALKLAQAERKASKTQDAYKIGVVSREILLSQPFRTGLMGAMAAPGAMWTASGMWIFPMTASAYRDATIGMIRDRDGIIRLFPINPDNPQFESRGDQGTVLPAARRSRSFFDEDGIARLSSFSRPRQTEKFSIASGSSVRPRKSSPSEHRARSAPSIKRTKKITPPWCPIHKRRHWCNVTRARFS